MEISPVSFGCKYVVKSTAPRRMVQTASQLKRCLTNTKILRAKSKLENCWLQKFMPKYTKGQSFIRTI